MENRLVELTEKENATAKELIRLLEEDNQRLESRLQTVRADTLEEAERIAVNAARLHGKPQELDRCSWTKCGEYIAAKLRAMKVKTKCDVLAYEVNGEDCFSRVGGQTSLIVRSHWNYEDRIELDLAEFGVDKKIVVMADDLEEAIKRCSR